MFLNRGAECQRCGNKSQIYQTVITPHYTAPSHLIEWTAGSSSPAPKLTWRYSIRRQFPYKSIQKTTYICCRLTHLFFHLNARRKRRMFRSLPPWVTAKPSCLSYAFEIWIRPTRTAEGHLFANKSIYFQLTVGGYLSHQTSAKKDRPEQAWEFPHWSRQLIF